MSDVAHRDDPMVGIRLAAHVDGSRRGFLKDVVEDGSGIPRSPNPLERARRRVGALAFLPDRELGHRCRQVVGGDELDQSGREPVVWECAAPTPPKRALLKPVTTGGGVWRSRLAARRAPLERVLSLLPPQIVIRSIAVAAARLRSAASPSRYPAESRTRSRNTIAPVITTTRPMAAAAPSGARA